VIEMAILAWDHGRNHVQPDAVVIVDGDAATRPGLQQSLQEL
jgi:hypothetical protein